MMIKLENGLIVNNNNYFYCDDNNFMFDCINYEKDTDNGRCYMLEYSSCLRADCDGKFVRKRISSAAYNRYLQELKAMIPIADEKV